MSKLIVNTIEAQTYKYDSDTTGLTLNSDGTFNRGTIPYWALKGPSTSSIPANGTVKWGERADSEEAIIGQSLGGGCTYDVSTGEVTVSISGLYQVNIHANVRSNVSGTNSVGIELVVNGTDVGIRNYFSDTTHTIWQDMSFSTLVTLDANDTIRVDEYYGNTIQVDGNPWGGFSGYLVG